MVEQAGSTFTPSFIANPASLTGSRIGTLAGHHEIDAFAGFAGNDLYVVDPVAGAMTRVDWTGGASVTKSAHAMDAHGEHFLILDSSGKLHLLDPADGWKTVDTVQALTAVSGTPTMVVSQADETAFITDNANQAIVVVDLETLSTRSIPLGFIPTGLAWVGIAGAHDDHAH